MHGILFQSQGALTHVPGMIRPVGILKMQRHQEEVKICLVHATNTSHVLCTSLQTRLEHI